MTHTWLPPVPSDATLEAVENLLPQLCALGDLFRMMTDAETHGRMVAELRKASADARAEAAKAAEAHAELEAARKAHEEAIARELAEHQQKMHAERRRLGGDHEKREKAIKGLERQAVDLAAAAAADREKAAELRADLQRRLDVIRSAAG